MSHHIFLFLVHKEDPLDQLETYLQDYGDGDNYSDALVMIDRQGTVTSLHESSNADFNESKFLALSPGARWDAAIRLGYERLVTSIMYADHALKHTKAPAWDTLTNAEIVTAADLYLRAAIRELTEDESKDPLTPYFIRKLANALEHVNDIRTELDIFAEPDGPTDAPRTLTLVNGEEDSDDVAILAVDIHT